MFVGTQYYIPPSPPKDRWVRDLRLIREHGIGLVRTWVVWREVNPSEGRWVWDDYDELFELARHNDLSVLIQLYPTPPDWLIRRQAQGGGGDLQCFDNPDLRPLAEGFMRRVAEHYKDHPSLFAYDVWNEPGEGCCLCSHSQVVLRKFLQEKYGSIDSFNRVWRTHWSSFDDVQLNETGGTGMGFEDIDRYEFGQYQQKSELQWRYDTVRQVDSDRILASHGHGHGSYLLFPWHDQWHMADVVDAWGCGFYLKTLHEGALSFHGCLAATAGKRWWVSEMCGGRQWSHVGAYLTSDAFQRSSFLMALGFGADGMIYTQWAPEVSTDPTSPHTGLTGLDGELTSRTEVVKSLAGMLGRNRGLFDAMTFAPSCVGLLWDQKTVIQDEVGQRQTSSIPGNIAVDDFKGWHAALLESSHQFDILNARLVAERGVPDNITVLAAPFQLTDRTGLCDQLKAWVENGGTLITGPLFGLRDDYGYVNPKVPPEWFGIKLHELHYPTDVRVEFTGGGLEHLSPIRGFQFFETFTVLDASVIGVVGEHPVAARKALGKGCILYIGTFVGHSYDFDTEPELRGLIRHIAAEAGVVPTVEAGSGCFVRTAQSGNATIIIVTNPRDRAAAPWLTFPALRGSLKDLLTGEDLGPVTEQRHTLPLTLGPEDSLILLMQGD